MRPNRKWIKPIWRPFNLKCTFSPPPDEISTKFKWLYLCFRGLASHWDSLEYYATKPEVDKTNMAGLNSEIRAFPLAEKIFTKCQRLYLCFREPAFHKHEQDYYATKPEVEKFKMAASKLKMHVSPLPHEISAKFQRLQTYQFCGV